MGLASALTTALTGLTAAETQIDVVGNNLANAQTVGFKASDTVFSTQFLQSLGLGSAPTTGSGGTNPRQTGLGVQVAEVTPDFTQGTIEISSNPSDLAIQGDGFFVVEGPTGERLYSRNGIFKTNSDNELVTVNGNRLLGHGVDELFTLQPTELVSLDIPVGATSVAQATQNVFLEGTLTPAGDVATIAEVLESAVLGTAKIPRPDASAVNVVVPDLPNINLTSAVVNVGGGTHTAGSSFQYKFVFADNTGTETLNSGVIAANIASGSSSVTLNSIPDSSTYETVRIYRTADGGADFFLLGEQATASAGGPANFVDDNSVALSATALDESRLNGNYSYLITFDRDGEVESRPSVLLGPQAVVDGRIRISNLPTPPAPGLEDDFPAYDKIKIYRNLVTDSSTFYEVVTLNPGGDFTDNISDATISLNSTLDFDGPKATPNTKLVDIVTRDELTYEQIFSEGTVTFEPRKGGRGLSAKSFDITVGTTLQEMIDFMEDATGIQQVIDDPINPIPNSENLLEENGELLPPGASVLANGRIRFVSNNGIDNAVQIGLSAFTLTEPDGSISTPTLAFGKVQDAAGQSAVADFLVYDTLGTALNVRVTAILESRSGSATTYRWYADSADNDPLTGSDISVGTGLVTYDGEGNFLTSSNDTISIDRRTVPAASPLEFDLDFSQISGLAEETASLAASRQDGSAPGTLTSFTIGEDGIVRGVFDNGVSRTLGQVRMVRFTNPSGLEQRGQNLFGAGANSGLPVEGDPGENGLGTLIAGAVELSNTDIGANLIDLVLATTQYRGNTRVITTAQQLIDELLNLRR